jgi:hypothetical protein
MLRHGTTTIEAIIPTATSITIRIITGTLAGEQIAVPVANFAYAE